MNSDNLSSEKGSPGKVSEERTTSIFMVEEAKHENGCKHRGVTSPFFASSLLGLRFESEDGTIQLPRNVSELALDQTALHPRIHLVVDLRPAHLRPQKNNKLIINQDVLLRTPITQGRRHIKDD
jgi:hypothetical protein